MSGRNSNQNRKPIPVAIWVALFAMTGTIVAALLTNVPPDIFFRPTATQTSTPASTPFPPTLDLALVTPQSGGIRSQALVYEAEDMGDFRDEPHREYAFKKRTVHLGTADPKLGDRIIFAVDIEQEGWCILYIRHSNDNLDGNPPEILDIFLDGKLRGQFFTEDTGNFSEGWDVFREPPFGDLFLSVGSHQIEIVVTKDDGFGVEIDAIILVRR